MAQSQRITAVLDHLTVHQLDQLVESRPYRTRSSYIAELIWNEFDRQFPKSAPRARPADPLEPAPSEPLPADPTPYIAPSDPEPHFQPPTPQAHGQMLDAFEGLDAMGEAPGHITRGA